MKKSLYILLVLTLMMGCEPNFLDTQPTDAVSADQIFLTTENALTSLNGIHRALNLQFGHQGQGGEGAAMIIRDMLGEDLVNTSLGNGFYISVYRWNTNVSETSSDVQFIWEYYYTIISNANMIIANIDNASGPKADIDVIKGQALAYRAWAHLNLVQFYGKRYDAAGSNSQLGVPIVLEPILVGGPRNTVEEVYARVHEDLEKASKLLNEDRHAKSHLNINVVNGIKARAYLSQGKFAEAASFANLARNGYTIMNETELFEGFNNVDNPEWIWGFDQIDLQTTYFTSYFAYMSLNFSSTNIRSNPKAIFSLLYDKMTDTDLRRGLWDPTGTTFEPPSNRFVKKPYMNRKFLAQGESSSVGDVPYMRASEMVLIEAEAMARSGNNSKAAEVLYELAHARDPKYLLSTNTGQLLIEEIMVQRRVELWGEGFRFFDLKRLNLPLDRTGGNHVSTVLENNYKRDAGSNEWQWKIPLDEINANDKIIQNPS